MSDTTHYAIHGGIQGRERLRVISRIMHPTSSALLDRLGVRDDLLCADFGCGGGDVTVEIARRVAPGAGFDVMRW
jgi:ubiquinone/menaquinone biosynthesis C-methylase UbiE